MQQDETQQKGDRPATGCALAILAVNTALIGLATASFTQGPYYSHEQELWYRYGSLGFLMVGVVIPAVALFAGRRSGLVVGASVAWMAMTLFAFIYYAMMSGGGM
jgi:hypothetical protein